jgi:hypothetical protein
MNYCQAPEPGPNRWRNRLIYGLVVTSYLLFTLIQLRHLLPVLGSGSILFGGDTALNIYIIAWNQFALLTNPLDIFNANYFTH